MARSEALCRSWLYVTQQSVTCVTWYPRSQASLLTATKGVLRSRASSILVLRQQNDLQCKGRLTGDMSMPPSASHQAALRYRQEEHCGRTPVQCALSPEGSPSPRWMRC